MKLTTNTTNLKVREGQLLVARTLKYIEKRHHKNRCRAGRYMIFTDSRPQVSLL